MLRCCNLVTPPSLQSSDASDAQVLIKRGVETTDKLTELINTKQSRDELTLVTWSSGSYPAEVIKPVFSTKQKR